MTTTAPARSDSPTNLRHEEAAWRASVCQVTSSHVAIDVTTAIDPSEVAFTVHCRMHLHIRRPVEGLWVDFVGQGVDSLSIDGRLVAVIWDGARIALPVLDPGGHVVEIGAHGLYSNSGQGLHRFHDPVDGATYLYTHFEPSDARGPGRSWSSRTSRPGSSWRSPTHAAGRSYPTRVRKQMDRAPTCRLTRLMPMAVMPASMSR